MVILEQQTSIYDPEKCREWAMNFSLNKIGERYEEYFNMVMNVYISEGWYAKTTDRKSLNWLNKQLS
jgi:hypothetical protein